MKSLVFWEDYHDLLTYAIKQTDADYFMFCDQDDIWLDDKVEKTLLLMQSEEKELSSKPLLIHTDLKVVDAHLHVMAPSFWSYEYINPSANTLNRLLLQNTVTGCTAMLNRKLAELSLPIHQSSIMHDWWIALVASAFGKISYLNESTILYRQHENNDTGAKRFSFKTLPRKIFTVFFTNNHYLKYLNQNLKQAEAFLQTFEAELTSSQIEILRTFISLPKKSWFHKRRSIVKYRLFKNGMIRNTALLLRA